MIMPLLDPVDPLPPVPDFTAGIFDLSFEQYRATPAYGKHDLEHMERSAYHFHYHQNHPEEKKSAALGFGSAVHTAVLEPDRFTRHMQVGPTKTRTSKAWMEAEAAEPDAIFVTEDELQHIEGIATAVIHHPTAKKLLGKGEAERSAFNYHPETGIPLRCRPDFMTEGSNIISDLKTCQNASGDAFGRDAGKFNYHVQAAFYLDILKSLGRDVDHFVLIAVESTAPHGIQTYQLPEEWINEGRTVYESWLHQLHQCLQDDHWPGYGKDLTPLQIPLYHSKTYETV